MKKALVVGGTRGIGLSIATELLKDYSNIAIIGKRNIDYSCLDDNTKKIFKKKVSFFKLNLSNCDYSFFDRFKDIDTLIITAGFGRVAHFEDLTEQEIKELIKVNQESAIQIIKRFYNKLKSNKPFYVVVMGSITGHVTSPLFSVYSSAKAGLCMFIKNINAELAAQGYKNRILDVSPGSLKGTSFNGDKSDLTILKNISQQIIKKMYARETLWIPKYKEIYKEVIDKDKRDPLKFGVESYNYKVKNNRLGSKPQLVMGYLSGTFDLFHIGHLNVLRRAKENCDYLIVGIHKSGAHKGKETFIPLNERKAIVSSIKYVDKVVIASKEDSTNILKYGCKKLFVGSDYKGSEKFNRYEKQLIPKGIEIVYFPYTKRTNSTQLRKVINKKVK